MTIEFTPPSASEPSDAVYRAIAAADNLAVADKASGQLLAALSGDTEIQRVLLKAAAGAGKSYVLRRLVADAVDHPNCARVALIAFQNRQLWPLARSLGETLGKEQVALLASRASYENVPDYVHESATVVSKSGELPKDCTVVIATSHRLGAMGERKRISDHLGPAANSDTPFDVLLVDEAWQLPHHLFDRVERAAPITVGVGDVGQLPPLEIGTNPWRGDPGFNPYRAWPTNYYGDEFTYEDELPAVWRPTAEQLPLWRAFYPEWAKLNCVAAPGDRSVELGKLEGLAADVWAQVGTGIPTLLEVGGLGDAEAADVDMPLVEFAEELIDSLFSAGFSLVRARTDDAGTPTNEEDRFSPGDDSTTPSSAFSRPGIKQWTTPRTQWTGSARHTDSPKRICLLPRSTHGRDRRMASRWRSTR